MTRKTFETIMNLSAPGTPLGHISLTLEYMSQDKVNNVPSAATACVRNKPGLGNGSVQVVWDEDKPELLAEARRVANEIADVAKAEELRYGNYSALLSWLLIRLHR